MADFKLAHKIVMGHEGGYANNPLDKGGETYKGIARKRHPNWPGWKVIDANKSIKSFPSNLSVNGSLESLVLDFYKVQFWDELNLDAFIDQPIATELYDTGVNMGTGIAGIFLQTALNVSNRNANDYPDVKKDGRIGPQTTALANGHQRPGDLLKVINCLQGERYISIMERDPTQEVFFRSWFSRVAI